MILRPLVVGILIYVIAKTCGATPLTNASVDSTLLNEWRSAVSKRLSSARGTVVARFCGPEQWKSVIAYRTDDGAFILVNPRSILIRDADGRIWEATSPDGQIIEREISGFVNPDWVLDEFMYDQIVRDLVDNSSLITAISRGDPDIIIVDASFQRCNRGMRPGAPHEHLNPLSTVRFEFARDGSLLAVSCPEASSRVEYKPSDKSRPGFDVLGLSVSASHHLCSIGFFDREAISFTASGARSIWREAIKIGSDESASASNQTRPGSTTGGVVPRSLIFGIATLGLTAYAIYRLRRA